MENPNAHAESQPNAAQLDMPPHDTRNDTRNGAPTPVRLRVVMFLAMLAPMLAIAGCASGPPEKRTVLFLRHDLDFTDVWDATHETLALEFPPGTEDVTARSIVTGHRYDDASSGSIRWYAIAMIEPYDRNWAVHVTTIAEKLRSSGWKRIGRDDKTSQWLVRRIDERVRLRSGAPPSTGGLATPR